MPGFIARKLCPELVIVPPDFSKYTKVSRDIRDVFALYDPQFATVSLDEAYLDITQHLEKRHSLTQEERTFRSEYQCRFVSVQF